MAVDKPPDSPVERALKKRKELQETIRAAMQDLEKIEQFLKTWRDLSIPDDSTEKGADGFIKTLGKAGAGMAQPLFEQMVRSMLMDNRRPMRSDEVVEEFQKRGQPLGGNETRTAWNRLWSAKNRGVLVNIPKLGYWLADEPLPKDMAPPRKRKTAPAGMGKRKQSEGKIIGRRPWLTAAQLKQAEEWLLEGLSRAEIGRRLGGISPPAITHHFPGGPEGIRKRRTAPVKDLSTADAKREHAHLRIEIAGHDRRYYQEDAPTISDAEYDAMKRRLSEIESQFPELKNIK